MSIQTNNIPDNIEIGTPINGSIHNTTYITNSLEYNSFFSQYKLYILLILIISFIIIRLVRKNKAAERNTIYLVGERNAGKTQLLYLLAKGANVQTVPSIRNNNTTYILDERKSVQLIDVAGSNHTKQQFVSNIDKAVCIVEVVDGSNTQSLLGTAELLYKILISKSYQKLQPKLCIFLNKNDLVGFLGQKMFQKKLQDQIQRIKLSRRTMIEQKQGQDDTIKQQRGRWSLQQYDIKIISGSVLQKDVSSLESFILQ